MRDALLLLAVFAALLPVLRYPFAGLLVWAWFTIMTPHQMAYGVYGVPLNLVIAAVTLGAMILNAPSLKLKPTGAAVWIGLFAFWLFVSQAFSLDEANSAVYFDRFIKTLLFALLCAQLTDSKLKLHALLWSLVIGLGYFGAKGALFTAATLGQYRVQGIPETILEDNNHMGIALATALPLMLYLRGEVKNAFLRGGLTLLFAMTMFSIFGTQSRGAFISLVAFAGFYWLQSKHKVSIIAGLALLMAPAIVFMPSSWTERMATIGEATQDESFMGRVDAWVINFKFAVENPVTGAGLRNPYHEDLAKQVDAERAERAKAAHSIYFEVLGGTGFVGFTLFAVVLAQALFGARRLSKMASAPGWIGRFGYFSQISLSVFFIGGASTSMEMWDGYWIVIALVAAATRLSGMENVKASVGGAPTRPRNWRTKARGVTAHPARAR